MNPRIVRALVVKDLALFSRDKFFGLMTLLSFVMFVVFFFVMPKTLDETIEIGIHAPESFLLFNLPVQEGLIIRYMESGDALKQAVIDKKVAAGLSIPEDIAESLSTGGISRITVYHVSDLPEELEKMYTVFLGEMMNMLAGHPIPLEIKETVLGLDLGGKQIPYRDRLIPFFIFMVLIMEIFGLANLITSEIQNETVSALLSTPMSVVDLFAGKGITGISLAFVQSILFLGITGHLVHNGLSVILTVFLSSILITALSFIIASIAKDMLSVIAWGTLLMIVLILPALSMLFPGMASGWIKSIPSFYIIDTLHRAIYIDTGWNVLSGHLLVLIMFNILFLSAGIIALKRKIA